MATAVYKATKDPGQEPNLQGIASVEVNDGEGNLTDVDVSYWPSLITQWTAAGVQAYVCAEALFVQGFYDDARTAATAGMTTPDPNNPGSTYGQTWASQHPDPGGGLG
jgi:hypothetical protein